MKDIYDLLKEIKDRYPLYVRGKFIHNIESFLWGYLVAKKDFGLERTKQEKDFEHFHKWLQKRLNAKTNLSWSKIIVFRSGDEIDAANNFFELLEEFINRDKTFDDDDIKYK